MLNESLFSSQKTDWATPDSLFSKIDEEFHFTLDVCAQPHNTKCLKFFSPEQDGLRQDWGGVCWMNPPYGKDIKKWIQKAREEAIKGAIVVCLVPVRTDTAWWHENVLNIATEIRFLRGRIKFVGAVNSAPFPSALIIYKYI